MKLQLLGLQNLQSCSFVYYISGTSQVCDYYTRHCSTLIPGARFVNDSLSVNRFELLAKTIYSSYFVEYLKMNPLYSLLETLDEVYCEIEFPITNVLSKAKYVSSGRNFKCVFNKFQKGKVMFEVLLIFFLTKSNFPC